jgi:hypothetical protein
MVVDHPKFPMRLERHSNQHLAHMEAEFPDRLDALRDDKASKTGVTE